jgi:WD40 repeat protein
MKKMKLQALRLWVALLGASALAIPASLARQPQPGAEPVAKARKEDADGKKASPATKREFTGRFSNPVFSADGRLLAYSCDPVNDPSQPARKRPHVHVVWDVAAAKEIVHVEDTKPDDPWLACIGLSPDGKKLAVAMANTSIRIWDLADGKETCRLTESRSGHVAFAPDGVSVLANSAKGLRLWDARNGKEVRQFDQTTGKAAWSIKDIRLAADGKTLLTTNATYRKTTPGKQPGPYAFQFVAQTWDVATGKLVRELGETIQGEVDVPHGLVSGLTDIKRGKGVVVCADRVIQVCDAETGKKTREFKAPWDPKADGIGLVAISGTAPIAATATRKGDLALWDLAAGKRLWSADADTWQIDHMIFNPEGNKLVITGRTSDQKLATLLIYDLTAAIPRGTSY